MICSAVLGSECDLSTALGTATHISQLDHTFRSIAHTFKDFSKACLQVAGLAHLPASKKSTSKRNRPPQSHLLSTVMSTPTRSRSQSLNDDSSSPSSPTPTIRNTTPARPPTASQVFAAAVAASPGPAPGRAASQPGMDRRQSGQQQQQQELGKGRPGRDDPVSEGGQGVVA